MEQATLQRARPATSRHRRRGRAAHRRRLAVHAPAPHQYHGTGAIQSFLHAAFAHRGGRRLYLVPAGANTQPALAGYLSDPARAVADPAGLFVLTMAGTKIHAITRFHLDELYPRFGLARSLPEPARAGQSRP